MNKTRITLIVTGGVIVLAVLAAAYFAWSAFGAKKAAFEGDDETEGLENFVGKVSSYMNKKPYPSMANAKKIEANRAAVEAWRREALKLAAVGDWCADAACTPAQFKESVVREARRLAAYPGTADGKIMKSDFTFGPFKDFLADKMPSKDQLPRLQRQWYDIAALCDLLATNGVTQIIDLQTVERAAAEKPNEKASKKKSARKTAKEESVTRQPSVETYRIAFEVAPPAFVAILRQLSFQDRFTTVEGFSFAHVRDPITETLGAAGEKKEAATAQTKKRRASGRRRAAAADLEEKNPEEEKKGSLVFNPETDATVRVEMTVSVYDFRTLEDDKDEEVSK